MRRLKRASHLEMAASASALSALDPNAQAFSRPTAARQFAAMLIA
jgi:hypothetical protein